MELWQGSRDLRTCYPHGDGRGRGFGFALGVPELGSSGTLGEDRVLHRLSSAGQSGFEIPPWRAAVAVGDLLEGRGK
jgi:hypothetical protein